MEAGKKMSKTTIWIIVAILILIALVVLYFTVFKKKNGAEQRREKTPEELIDEAMPDAIREIDSAARPAAVNARIKGYLPQAKKDILLQWNDIADKTKAGLTSALWGKAQYIYNVRK